MHSKKELSLRLEQAGVRPLKKLGQNFLVNEPICQKIVEKTKSENPKAVVEIGPGLGALTDELISASWRLVLVEIDGGLVEHWKRVHPGLEIINNDALKIDWNSLALGHPAVLVSNLPYSIAASLVVELSASENPFDTLILMFQKEVAQRIQSDANESDYGMLSVIAQVSWDIERVIDAGPQDFHPVPHIGSRVLRMTRKKANLDRSAFLKFIKLGFSHRRKKLISNLAGQYDRQALEMVFNKEGFDLGIRPQELSPSQFVSAFDRLKL
jgi:16S rRNA (adenine1518-N6/adenine1519-N6)-dimethyltransferase